MKRIRYYYIVKKNNKILYEGFILHEEAWSLLLKLKDNVSVINTGKTTEQIDNSFYEFFKSL